MSKLISAGTLALLGSLLPSTCFAATFWYCQVQPRDNQHAMYFSDTFGPIENLMRGRTPTQAVMMKAFGDYVAAKYSDMGFPGCAYFDSEQKARAELKRNEGLVKGKFIETGWRFVER